MELRNKEIGERIICHCFRKSLAEIIDTVHVKNCKTVDDIGDEIGAGTRCGSCIPMLERILEVENKRKR